ncbi:DUF2635 domain-containing protein [Cupriavidus pauculus]|uniref:DUF2635 domain-containing protein n=1 Tax=Cupriavidus pauculus TaxID=82633 RepID=A0A2N5C433_9BURK|nr:DUF2635 domain-containing protein [Cupriavidus pauculus]PLP96968.1 DUF2635 domain-containing protein [Cupriavidus pauculus]
MKVKPAEGLKVRDPVTRQFIDDNYEIDPTDFYWNRRLRDGDVIEVGAAPKGKANAATEGAKE